MSWSQPPPESTRSAPERVEGSWQATPRGAVRQASGPRRPVRRSNPSVQAGPIRLTPTRVTLAVALVGSMLYLFYAISVRDASQIPLLSSGAGVLGIVFCALAISGGYATYRAASEGRTGQALGLAIGGGLAGMIAAGCFALALVLALAWQSG